MILGKVVGNVVCTVKAEVLSGQKILIVQPLDAAGAARGKTVLALDAVQAGEGDTVLVLDEGNSSRMILGDPQAAVRTMIVGIVDAVHTEAGADDNALKR
jgi:microcompartment protein CcmK/EutM